MARRKASPTQRSALIARDGACIGCGAKAAWCQSHHIIHWQDGGPTNLDNMCLLCSRCHHNVHDRIWQVEQTPTGAYRLRPPPPKRTRRSRRKYQLRQHHRTLHPAKQRK
ncbi:MAG: HNH endonuclease signature motif containing protein [bacterium]|nr:HNH endonuclease signature motif containing protein [bacterium]